MESSKVKYRAFLLMPFESKFDWLREVIVLAGIDAQVLVERADDIFEGGVIVEQIKNRLEEAHAVIAVVTGRNANVFFELGVADHYHNPILIAEEIGDVPFDIQHYRVQFYGGQSEGDRRDTLRKRIASSLAPTVSTRTSRAAGARIDEQPRPVVLDQHMMQLTVVDLHRKGSFDRIVIDVAALVENVDSLDSEGRIVQDNDLDDTVPILGRHTWDVRADAERLGLISKDFDLDRRDFALRLTRKGTAFLRALRTWSNRDGPLYFKPRR